MESAAKRKALSRRSDKAISAASSADTNHNPASNGFDERIGALQAKMGGLRKHMLYDTSPNLLTPACTQLKRIRPHGLH